MLPLVSLAFGILLMGLMFAQMAHAKDSDKTALRSYTANATILSIILVVLSTIAMVVFPSVITAVVLVIDVYVMMSEIGVCRRVFGEYDEPVSLGRALHLALLNSMFGGMYASGLSMGLGDDPELA